MIAVCPYCGYPHLTQYIGLGGDFLCTECARREIVGLLTDYDKSEIASLRRKIEDRLRKSPVFLKDIIVQAVMFGQINM